MSNLLYKQIHVTSNNSINGRLYLEINLKSSSVYRSIKKYLYYIGSMLQLYTGKHKSDIEPVEIIKNLYIGSAGCAFNKESLTKSSVSLVINSAIQLNCPFKNDFSYLKINIFDNIHERKSLNEIFQITNDIISSYLSRNEKVFIHCNAGKSRSASIIIAYLIRCCGYTYDQALELCKEKRKKVQPNEGFEDELKKYEKEVCS